MRKLQHEQLSRRTVLLNFYDGDHRVMIDHYNSRIEPNWPKR